MFPKSNLDSTALYDVAIAAAAAGYQAAAMLNHDLAFGPPLAAQPA